MHTTQTLITIACILLSAFFSGVLFRRFNQSIIIAYLLSGIVIGPHGLGIIRDPEQIDVVSEIGVILLMFILGLGFPPKRIVTMGYYALLGGIAQIVLTALGTMYVTTLLGWNVVSSALVGSAVALSSTAIVIKVLNDLAVIDSLHGRLMVSYLIVQDLAAVLVIAVLPSLAKGTGIDLLLPIASSLTKGLAFVGIFLLLNRKLIPRVQYWVAAIGGKELFLIGTIVFCLGMAIVSQVIGLSFALGAFLAGLMVSDSEFNYQMRAGIVPFRDIFLCIFFVALGMLLDPRFFIHHPGKVLLVVVGIITVKFLFTLVATCLNRYSLKTALFVGIGLAQIGEFSFVIVQMGLKYHLVSEYLFHFITTAALFTMAVTPLMIKVSPQVVEQLNQVKWWKRWVGEKEDGTVSELDETLRNHVVICGYGPIGITIGRVLKAKHIPFAALELNAQTVVNMRGLGINCFYGDATSPEVLKKVHVERAKLAVVTIPDPLSAEAVVKNVKNLNPDCFILVRTRFSKELDELYEYGADAVVQEEFEAGLSMLVRTLKVFKASTSEIKQEVETIRIERDELTKTCYLVPLALSKQLAPQRIILRLAARTKEEAIRELVHAVFTSHRIHDQDELVKRILEREQMESTGIGEGVAIPHARTDAVEDLWVCLGISPKGIDYHAIDEKLVHILILLAANESAHEAYLNTLSSVASLFNDTTFRRTIIRCKDATQVINLIKEREKILQDKKECKIEQ